jgi:hypothetical protein
MFWLFLSRIGNASFGGSFGSRFRKKQVLVDKFWEAPGVPKQTCFGKSKSIYQYLFFHRIFAMSLGLSISA